MKTLIKLSLLSIISLHLCANDLSWVDKQIEAIKPARPGIKNSSISNIKDPFIFLEKNGYKIVKVEKVTKVKTTKKIVRKYGAKPTLEMIINKSALINGKWSKVGDKINGYKLNSINKNSVNVSFHNKKYTLSLKSKTRNLKFKKK